MLNNSKSCRAPVRDFSEPLGISVGILANFNFVSFDKIVPSLFLFVLILSANISTQSKKM